MKFISKKSYDFYDFNVKSEKEPDLEIDESQTQANSSFHRFTPILVFNKIIIFIQNLNTIILPHVIKLDVIKIHIKLIVTIKSAFSLN